MHDEFMKLLRRQRHVKSHCSSVCTYTFVSLPRCATLTQRHSKTVRPLNWTECKLSKKYFDTKRKRVRDAEKKKKLRLTSWESERERTESEIFQTNTGTHIHTREAPLPHNTFTRNWRVEQQRVECFMQNKTNSVAQQDSTERIIRHRTALCVNSFGHCLVGLSRIHFVK